MVSQVKKYELTRTMYVPIKIGVSRSYGGRQQWFSKEIKELKNLKAYFTHMNGCGVIALSDLFLYLAMTLPQGRETQASQFLDTHGNITKEQYMAFVELVRDKYARIYASCGTFAWQLSRGMNTYFRDHNLPLKAHFEIGLSKLNLLSQMQQMLNNNYPILLMIGQSSPVVLSKLREIGIPFFKKSKRNKKKLMHGEEAYNDYEIVERNVYGHFVMVTGIIIDEKANWASQRIMLRIASWGEEYYISYEHYCYYMKQISKPWLCGIISIGK